MNPTGTQAGSIVAGRFALRERLGRGGHATVWRAGDMREGGEVALKLIHKKLRGSARAMARLRREVDVLRAMDHPNVARAVNIDIDADHPYFALELIDGVTLDQLLGRHATSGTPIPPRTVGLVVNQIASALHHAHELGIVHRDLKPANVIVAGTDEQPQIKLLDFGIAKILEVEASAATTQGRVLGTFTYMAPEQIHAEEVDRRADVYSLGVVLFELLTLKRAWHRSPDGGPWPAYVQAPKAGPINAVHAIGERVIHDPRPDPTAFDPGVNPRFSPIVMRAMARDREVRPETALALAAEVSVLLAQSPRWPAPVGEVAVERASDEVVPRTAVREPEAASEPEPTSGPDDQTPVFLAPAPVPPGSPRSWIAVGLVLVAVVATVVVVLIDRRTPAPTSVPLVEPPRLTARPGATAAPVAEPEKPRPTAGRSTTRRRPDPERARPAASPRRAPPASNELDRLLSRVRENPQDTAAMARLVSQISRRAATLPGGERSRITALAQDSAIVGDVEGLARAIRALESASAPK